MLVEHVEIRNKRGVGDVVLLALLLLPSWVALVRLFARGNTKLRNTARVRLFGKIPFGSGTLWGALIFALGCLFWVGFLSTETKDAADWWLCWLILVPYVLTGLWLMIYSGAYSSYLKAVDAMLLKIVRQGELFPGDLAYTLNGVKFKREQTVALLEDLRENAIADFDDLGGDCYRVWLVDPALVALAASEGITKREAPQGTASKRVAWTCPSCGAPNTTAEDGVCAYCGSGRRS